MSIDNTTYNFCIESLRYIHKMIGYNAIIEELNFIQRLRNPHKSEAIHEHVVSTMIGIDDISEYNSSSESEHELGQEHVSELKDTHKNIIIETKQNKHKYVRNELPDEKRCDFNLSNGKRCTFKKTVNSNYCSRHSK